MKFFKNILNKITYPFRALARFIGDVRSELSLLDWVKPGKLVSYTLVVLLYCLSLTVFIYLADLLLAAVRNGLLGQTTL